MTGGFYVIVSTDVPLAGLPLPGGGVSSGRPQAMLLIEADSGKDALQVCRTEPPDLVLTDLIMPDTDGMEVIRELRRSAPDVKIIAMSGGGRVDALDYLWIARRLGAVCTLNKPFQTGELVEAIDRALSEN